MAYIRWRFIVIAVAALLTLSWSISPSPGNVLQKLVLLSRNFRDGQTLSMQQVYTAAGGGNVSPELYWRAAPRAAKSFALIVYDPDARNGWWHWVQVDIPATAHELKSGVGNYGGAISAPLTTFSKNSFGSFGYDGPCPPIGDPPHHYVFTLYALDVPEIVVDPGESPLAVSNEIQSHAIAYATLTGRFGR
jgi:Raf kinase inhibitor-like YbhB/YbcL family protein